MIQDTDTVHVRYMVDDVAATVNFYTTQLGFTLLTNQGPAFGDVKRGDLRQHQHRPTRGPDCRGHLVESVAAPGQHGHRGAVRSKPERDGRPDAAARPGDECDRVLK